MEEENPIYIKIEYAESVEGKRNALSSEMSLINILKIIKRYNLLKEQESDLKVQLYKTARELGIAVRKTKSSFPFLKIPEKAKASEIKRQETSEVIIKEDINDGLESELRAIQEKLRSLG